MTDDRLRLKSIRLQNFKSFDDVRIDLGDLTSIIGVNASGKSNFRDALKVVHSLAEGHSISRTIAPQVDSNGDEESIGTRGRPDELTWESNDSNTTLDVVYSLHESQISYKITFSTAFPNSKTGPQILEEYVRLNDHDLFKAIVHDLNQIDGEDTLVRSMSVIPLADRERQFDVKSSHSILNKIDDYLIHLDFHEPSARKSYLELDSLLKNIKQLPSRMQKLQFLDLSPSAMRRSSFHGDNTLNSRGSNIASVLETICEDVERKEAIVGWLSELTPMDAKEIHFARDPYENSFFEIEEQNGRRTSAPACSDGTLRFLGYLAALYSPNPASLIVIEEIENGFHPTRVKLLIELIEQRARIDKTTQVIITTHSPEVLSFLSDEAKKDALLFSKNSPEEPTRVHRIAELPHVKEVLKKKDWGELMAAGWMEDVAFFSEDEEDHD